MKKVIFMQKKDSPPRGGELVMRETSSQEISPASGKKAGNARPATKIPRRGGAAMTTNALLSEAPVSRTEKTGYHASGEVSSSYRLPHLMPAGGNESAQRSGLACGTRLLPVTC